MAAPDASTHRRRQLTAAIAWVALGGIALHLVLRFLAGASDGAARIPLFAVLALSGIPLVMGLGRKLLRGEFGSDLLAGVSILTAVLLGQYLAGALVVLMLSGGEALEAYAVGRASSALRALAKRMPSIAHRRRDGSLEPIPLASVSVGDLLVVLPHEICPVDGVVVEGHGIMDESYLTGEPYEMSKAPGSGVLSGAVNGEAALSIRATRQAVDSRFAKILAVLRESEEHRPRIRRLGDRLGALYTPVALVMALLAWGASGDPLRFLAVLVVATPCPLLIAIPVAILGSISLAARRGIIIRSPAVLEQVDRCETIILDKTGTLTLGRPTLTEIELAEGREHAEVLRLTASVEVYSKHPLAGAVVREARREGLALSEAAEYREQPGTGLHGVVDGRVVELTSRGKAMRRIPGLERLLPDSQGGLEAIVLLDGAYAATMRFRDAPREDSRPFVEHLATRHGFRRVMLVSGDRLGEVQYLAEAVGIREVRAEQSPEEKVAITRTEAALAPTLFVGDGINDAPALAAATVGIAFGQHSDVTSEAAGAVIMDTSLRKVDEFFHIGRRLRRIALQSAVGGMLLSAGGMGLAAFGHLSPVAGAVSQEIIDLLAILNALRTALPPVTLHDFHPDRQPVELP